MLREGFCDLIGATELTENSQRPIGRETYKHLITFNVVSACEKRACSLSETQKKDPLISFGWTFQKKKKLPKD